MTGILPYYLKIYDRQFNDNIFINKNHIVSVTKGCKFFFFNSFLTQYIEIITLNKIFEIHPNIEGIIKKLDADFFNKYKNKCDIVNALSNSDITEKVYNKISIAEDCICNKMEKLWGEDEIELEPNEDLIMTSKTIKGEKNGN